MLPRDESRHSLACDNRGGEASIRCEFLGFSIRSEERGVSKFLEHIRTLVARDEVLVSMHGADELAADDIHIRDAINGLLAAELSRSILIIRRARASWRWNGTVAASRFTLSGVFQRDTIPPLCW